MNIDKFTSKFQSAIADAQSLAVGKDNPYIEPAHLMLALLKQNDGSITPLVTSLNVQPNRLISELDGIISRLPQVQGGNTQPSQQLIRLLNQCDKLSQQFGDSFISSELFVLCLLYTSPSPRD